MEAENYGRNAPEVEPILKELSAIIREKAVVQKRKEAVESRKKKKREQLSRKFSRALMKPKAPTGRKDGRSRGATPRLQKIIHE